MSMDMNHRALQMKLYEHVQSYDNVFAVRETAINAAGMGSLCQYADVCTIRKSYADISVRMYEVKASRADFLSDIRSDKWRGYLEYCNSFYFVTLEGIATKKDIPKEAGWLEYSPAQDRFTALKRATKRHDVKVNPPILLGYMLAYNRDEECNLRDKYGKDRILFYAIKNGLSDVFGANNWWSLITEPLRVARGTHNEIYRAILKNATKLFRDARNDIYKEAEERGYRRGLKDARTKQEAS